MTFSRPLPGIVNINREPEAVAVLGVESGSSGGIAIVCLNGKGQIFTMPPGSVKVLVDKELRECIAEAELQKP